MNSERAYQCWDIDVLKQIQGIPRQDFYEHLIGWAILAPNSHNVQPWQFLIHDNDKMITVRFDRRGVLSASDPFFRQAYVSLGCAIENLRIAACYYGFRPRLISIVEEHRDRNGGGVTMVLEGAAAKRASFSLLRAARERRMHRGIYDVTRPVSQYLRRSAFRKAALCGVRLEWITDAGPRFEIAELQYLSDRVAILDPEFRHELSSLFLPNDDPSFVGMPGATFGLDDEQTARVVSGLRTVPFDIDYAHGISAAHREGLRTAPVVGILGVRADEPQEWQKAGMVLEYILLAATREGYDSSILASLIEIPHFRRRLKSFLKWRSHMPVALFRIGKAQTLWPHSPRLSVSDVCVIVQ